MAPPVLYNMDLSPPCRLVRLVAGALGLELQIVHKSAFLGEMKAPDMLKINPQHTLPTMDDNGLYITESRAIATYLVSQYAKNDSLYPKDAKKRVLVDQRLYFDQDLYNRIMTFVMARAHGKEPDQNIVKKVTSTLESLNRMLDGKQWLAGDNITLADYSVVNSLTALEFAPGCDIDLNKYPNIAQWIPRVEAAIPKYQEQTEIFNNALKKFREQRR